MKIRLNYVGVNTDTPRPILILDQGAAIVANRQHIVAAYDEAAKYLSILGLLLDFSDGEAEKHCVSSPQHGNGTRPTT